SIAKIRAQTITQNSSPEAADFVIRSPEFCPKPDFGKQKRRPSRAHGQIRDPNVLTNPRPHATICHDKFNTHFKTAFPNRQTSLPNKLARSLHRHIPLPTPSSSDASTNPTLIRRSISNSRAPLPTKLR